MDRSPASRTSRESPIDAGAASERPASPSPPARPGSPGTVRRPASNRGKRRPLYGPIIADGIRVLVFLVAIAIGSGGGPLAPSSDVPTVPGGGTNVEYIYPMASRLVSDDFDRHRNRASVNPGTDYPSPIGMPVVAVKAGWVILAQHTFDGTGGRMIIINHGDSSRTEYLHLSRVDVSVHQYVEQGQQIGLSGASGKGRERGYGPHLHISLKIDEQNVDFEKYVGVVQ